MASPTGFPFKILSLLGSLSDSAAYQLRKRRCDLGFLRQAFKKATGPLAGAVLPSRFQRTCRRAAKKRYSGPKCVCNGLMVNVGLGQIRIDGSRELPLVTCGDDVKYPRSS